MEVNGFENYLIYEDGSIFSKKRNKFLKNLHHSDGYLQVSLCKDGKVKHFLIHRLIGLHYIPNPNSYPEIDHIDRNKLNNSIDNLRWCDRSINNQNKGLFTNNKLGISNIHYHKSKEIYIFKKTINGKSHEKRFTNLEDAIKYKEEYLNQLLLPTTVS